MIMIISFLSFQDENKELIIKKKKKKKKKRQFIVIRQNYLKFKLNECNLFIN
jgi:hypothetical protein